MINIHLTEDIRLLEEIETQLLLNHGHCPCQLERTKDTKCMCKSFKDLLHESCPGTHECTCGKYVAIIT